MLSPNRRKPAGFRAFLEFVREDWEANERDLSRAGLHALFVHRFGVWRSQMPQPVRAILYPLYALMALFVRNVYGIEISWRTRIGRRLVLAHQSGIVVHPAAAIGDGCIIRQNVTIGAVDARTGKAPRLGDRVEVGAGAVLIGDIDIGDGARIGPNAFVMTNVPPGSLVVPPQSRVIPPARLRTAMAPLEDRNERVIRG